jgi:FlaG/FlaF family flagellin (archaellin)
MKRFCDERGVALVMALILSLIILATVSALIYLVTQGTMMSSFQKRYQTAQEGAKGGVELVTKEILSETIPAAVQSSLSLNLKKSTLKSYFSTISLDFPSSTSDACLVQKLNVPAMIGSTNQWTNCSSDNRSMDLKTSSGTNISDMTFTLSGNPGAADFIVYAKIVDTVQGNTNRSGLDLQGQGVVDSSSGVVTPKQNPWMYKVELQAERSSNPDERSRLSILYAY